MSVFKEMDPEVAMKAIEGYENTLEREASEFDALYRSKKCHRCHSDLHKEFDSRHVFSQGTQIGRALLRCSFCRSLVDPFTNIILDTGNPSKVPESTIPIINPSKD